MDNTCFENVTGLDDDTEKHLTSAYDIALMSRELISHETILKYSSIWMDTIRDGQFGLTNTNRLIRFYDGATGLKTGSTAKAGFCISATAKRDGMHLIAVIMGSPTRDTRNEAARQLLDYGFSKYSLYRDEGGVCGEISVIGGVTDRVGCVCDPFVLLTAKGKAKTVQREILLENPVSAPVKAGDEVGVIRYLSDGETVGETPVRASSDVERISFGALFLRMLGISLGKC